MDPKSFLQSKTIYALLVAAVAYALKFAIGHGMLTSLDPQHAGQYLDGVLQLLEALGIGGAVLGRFAATQPITLLPPAPATPPADDPHDGGSNVRLPGFLVGAMLAITLLSGGCAQNETNRAAQGIVLVTAHAELAVSLHDAGVLTRPQELQIFALVQAEQAAAKAYYASIAAGDSATLAQAKAALAAATAAAAAELAKYKLPPAPAGSIQFAK